MPDVPDGLRPAADDPPDEPCTAVVVRAAPIARRSRWSDRVVTVAARLPDLARNPAVLATIAVSAGVAAEAAFALLRRAGGGPVPPTATIHITGVVVHRVQVVHHHLAHLTPSQATSRQSFIPL